MFRGLKSSLQTEGLELSRVDGWLPAGKVGAVCWSIDDVHPGTSRDAYEAGGDLGRGVLGRVEGLLERHPELRVTLFTTPDWRLISPWPRRRWLSRLPWLGRRFFAAEVYPPGHMRLDRHPRFVRYLRSLPRAEVGVHGLHHVTTGERMTAEFRGLSTSRCRERLAAGREIFARAGLEPVRGFQPPSWSLTPELATALAELGFTFVSSARDLVTPVSSQARSSMSGLRGASLIYPQRLAAGRLIHLTTNFQATSSIDRALAIIDRGGLLAIKAHAVKDVCGHIMADGLDELYRNYLDVVFTVLERRYGDTLWWTSMDEIARRLTPGVARNPALGEAMADAAV